jgi:hypothetical protein
MLPKRRILHRRAKPSTPLDLSGGGRQASVSIPRFVRRGIECLGTYITPVPQKLLMEDPIQSSELASVQATHTIFVPSQHVKLLTPCDGSPIALIVASSNYLL